MNQLKKSVDYFCGSCFGVSRCQMWSQWTFVASKEMHEQQKQHMTTWLKLIFWVQG